ncbi:MAG: hypothetical protein ACI31V_00660 [Bacilli bacterium]
MKLKEKLNNNEKYKKYKEYKESFKTIWNDPKLGSAIKLSIWLILILILSLMVRLNDKVEEPKPSISEQVITPTRETILNKLNNINNYEEFITVETDIIENITLTHSNNEDLIIYNNEKYYNKDNLYLLSTNEIIENQLLKDIIYFNINNIKDRLQNLEEDYITVYKDNSYIISYTIPTKEIPSFELLEKIEPTNKINITISGKDNINKIEINFENYNIKKITLELLNINNIDNININMEVN